MKFISQIFLVFFLIVIAIITGCSNTTDKPSETLSTPLSKETSQTSEAFNNYWYAGTAEITSYQLEQARYGEIHKGKAVMIYVTEDFNPTKQVKVDTQRSDNVSVLKLNATKKFNTGIYPYSVMTSTFYPVTNQQHAIKVTSSMQEWCGHVFMQLNNREKFKVQSYSYFESESDQKLDLEKSIIEDELWAQLRISPNTLPTGTHQIIPSFEMIRMRHVPLKSYKAELKLDTSDSLTTYTISYPELKRTVAIHFNSYFPHDILSWTETTQTGYGNAAKILTTKATKIKQIKSAYWSKNSVKDSILRKELGL